MTAASRPNATVRGASSGLVIAAVLVSLGVSWLADMRAAHGSLDVERYQGWVQRGHALTVTGLWPGSAVAIELLVRPRGVRGTLVVQVNADSTPVRVAKQAPQTLAVRGTADATGVLHIGLLPEEKGQGHVRVETLAVHQEGPAAVPLRRLLWYSALVLLGAALGRRLTGAAWGAASGALVSGLLVALAVVEARLETLLVLPWLLPLFAATLLLAVVGRRAGMPRWTLTLIALLFLVRTTASLQPAFPSIDAGFHSENLQRFTAGDRIESAAPGPERGGMAVPYPTAFYALLSPASGLEWPTPQFLVRLGMALLECTVPFLVFALMRRGGASEAAAAYGAAAQAVMPEAILALGKGIAANIAGGWASLLVMIGLCASTSPVTTAALFALAFLSHLGAGVTLGLLVAVWSVLGLVRWGWSWRRALAVLAPAGLGLAVAWLVYYREVQSTAVAAASSIESHAVAGTASFFSIRWYRVGKLVQDLVLKFGLTPLPLAYLGMRGAVPERLRQLLVAWFATGAVAGLLALASPLPLRFEYFLVPAVATAAGIGSEQVSRRWRALGLLVPLAVQLVLAGFLLARRFYLISVIMESPRWPFPFVL